jgi:hypothetical protein
MTDTASAIPYGSAALGQGLYATGTSAANWAYSPWDTTTVTAAAGTGAGTSPPAPAVGTSPTASPVRGSVTWGTGTATSAAAQVAVTYGATLPSVPVVTVSPTTTATATLNTFVTSVTATGFTVSCQVAPTASQGATVFGVAWSAWL